MSNFLSKFITKTTRSNMLEIGLSDKEIDKLNLDPLTRQSARDLVALIKAQIMQQLNVQGPPQSTKMLVVKQIVQIVHDTAAARIVK